MLHDAVIFGGFSVDNIAKALEFYRDTLGLEVTESEGMGLTVTFSSGGSVFIYEKPDHLPATFTILNFSVENIDDAVAELSAKGVTPERYDSMPGKQDERGILRGKAANMGPDIAWFKDPAGNILSVLSN